VEFADQLVCGLKSSINDICRLMCGRAFGNQRIVSRIANSPIAKC
jgi:hypothetical protein